MKDELKSLINDELDKIETSLDEIYEPVGDDINKMVLEQNKKQEEQLKHNEESEEEKEEEKEEVNEE